jgi:hypothetical protein
MATQLLGVNIALGRAPVDRCAAYTAPDDGVWIDRIVEAVTSALEGCP